jgi:hypothetical protein
LSLGDIGPDAALSAPALTKLLENKDTSVRDAAIDALGRIQPDPAPAVPVLAKLLTDQDFRTRCRVIEALSQIGPGAAEAVPALVEAFPKEELGAKQEILAALGHIKGKPEVAIPLLTNALKEPQLLPQAAEALAAYGPAAVDSLPALLEALKAARPGYEYEALAHAIYFLKPDALPKEPRSEYLNNLLGTWKPYTASYTQVEKERVTPELQAAKAKLDEAIQRASQPRDEVVLSKGALSPGNIQWTISKTEKTSDTAGAKKYTYTLGFQGDSKAVLQFDAYEIFGDNDLRGMEPVAQEPPIREESFAVAWVRTPDLVCVHWLNAAEPGTGHYTDEVSILLLKTSAGWKEIYRNSCNCFGRGGWGIDSFGAEDFLWDAKEGILTVRFDDNRLYMRDNPEPLSVRNEEGLYVQEINEFAERLFRFDGETLKYIGGKRFIDPGPGSFKVADVPLYLKPDMGDRAVTVATIRKLNPRLGKDETFSGPLVYETGIPAKDKRDE